jgi:Na+-driven multidrug efflux pump
MMALLVSLKTFNMVYVSFLNGVGKIKLQLVTGITSILLNIPLSFFFAEYLGLGVKGVVIATCCSLGYSVILRPLQYFKIINRKAKGIWDA